MAGGMPWFKVHAGWSSHPKVGRLCDVLANDLADAYVGRLWDYCAERQGDGRFPMPGAPGAVERAARWMGSRGALVEALLAVGLLDREEDGTLVVHDWAEEQKAVAEKFERDRQKKGAPRGIRADSSQSPRDSLSTLYSPVSASPSSAVVASRSAELEGGAREQRDSRAESARTQRGLHEMDGAPEDYMPPRGNPSTADAEVLGGGDTEGTETLEAGVDRVFREVRGTGYQLDSADMRASRQLLALAGNSVPEVLRRFANGLQAQFKQRVDTLAELAVRKKWEANAQPEDDGRKAAAPAGAHVGRGGSEGPCATGCGRGAQAELHGHALCYPCMGVAQQEVANFSTESVGAWVARRRAA